MPAQGVSNNYRRGRILETVRKKTVTSQSELSGLLRREGIRATQSTLSRDIRELGLVKVRGVYQAQEKPATPKAGERVRRAIQMLVVDSGVSGNMLMLRTEPGNGHALGVAIDAARWPEVLGTVAGDDTVFALLRSPRLGRSALRRVEGYLG